MSKYILVSFLLLILWIDSGAQSLVWTKSNGRQLTAEMGYGISPLSDGNFIIAGLSGNIGFGQEDALLMKVTPAGDTLWIKTFGTGSNGEFIRAVVETAGGELVMLGYTESYGAGAADIWLIKTDGNGNLLWHKTYGGALNDDGYSLKMLPDGFIIAGNSRSFHSQDNNEIYLIRTDTAGNIIWSETYPVLGSGSATDIIPTTDGGFLVTGYRSDATTTGYDLFLLKTGNTGGEQWVKSYGGPGQNEFSADLGYHVLQVPEGGYVISGSRNMDMLASFSGTFWLLKTDAAGDTLWTRSAGNNTDTFINGSALRVTSDSGYLVLANRYVAEGDIDPYVLRFDKDGDKVSELNISLPGTTDVVHSICAMGNNGYMVTGYTQETEAGYQVLCMRIADEDNPTGINKAKSEALSFSPNPVKEVLQIGSGVRLPFNYVIYDVVGKVAGSGHSRSSAINVASFLPGHYIIRTENGGWGRFLKQ